MRKCTHPLGCDFCAWCGFDLRNARLFEELPHGLRHIESSETGDYFEMTLPSADDRGRPYRAKSDDD